MKIGHYNIKPRGIIIFVVLIVVLIVILVSCNAKKPNNTVITNEFGEQVVLNEIEQFNYKFRDYIGDNKNGTSVKELISKVESENANKDADKKIVLELSAFRGSLTTDYNYVFEKDVSKGIGNEFSRYSVSEKEYDSEGRIKTILIKQIVGNIADPEIVDPTDSLDLYFDESTAYDVTVDDVSVDEVSVDEVTDAE